MGDLYGELMAKNGTEQDIFSWDLVELNLREWAI